MEPWAISVAHPAMCKGEPCALVLTDLSVPFSAICHPDLESKGQCSSDSLPICLSAHSPSKLAPQSDLCTLNFGIPQASVWPTIYTMSFLSQGWLVNMKVLNSISMQIIHNHMSTFSIRMLPLQITKLNVEMFRSGCPLES